MKRWFCTYFDHRYAPRALVMLESLSGTGVDVHLFALCMDDEAHKIFSALGDTRVTPISLRTFETGDSALLAAKAERTLIEYYFTCTPSLPLFVFRENKDVELLTYVDADLYFLSSPELLLALLPGIDVTIVPHRYPRRLTPRLRKWGLYNVGWLTFRRSECGFEVLEWWRERCLEWCFDRAEDGRFADQGYLDDWPERFPGVGVLTHPGANLAPWNAARHRLELRNGELLADGTPVLFYHVHGLKAEIGGLYKTSLADYSAHLTRPLKEAVYRPYVRALQNAQRSVSVLRPRTSPLTEIRRVAPARPLARLLHTVQSAVRRDLLWSSRKA